MNETKERETYRAPYYIESESVCVKKGCWNVNEVKVMGPTGQVGTYQYGYSGTPPFCPFEHKGQWYALYSGKEYTQTRIMKLPSCEDVWSSEGGSCGFCPVEFFVPAGQDFKLGPKYGYFAEEDDRCHTLYAPSEHSASEVTENQYWYGPVQYLDFGFLCGCVWGDDTSWKIQALDLSRLDEGVVTQDSRFGYIEMHHELNLRQSVSVDWSPLEKDGTRISITTQRSFRRDGVELKPHSSELLFAPGASE